MAKKQRRPAAPPPPPPARAAIRRLQWWQPYLLFAFAVLLYANTLGHGYALDDAIVVTDNAIVERGVAGWPELFTTDTFYGFFQDADKGRLVAGGRYRPLTPAMFALERQLFGGPFVHHLVNVLCYGLLTLVVFWLVGELARGRGRPWWFAAGVAALFAAHPIHTEAVANIKGRDEILALLGGLAACLLLLRAARGRGGRYGAVAGAGCLLAACLAKENAVTFAAVVPLLLFTFAGGRAALRYALPAIAAVAVFLVVRGSVIGWGLGEPVLELMNNPFLKLENGNWVPLATGERLATVFHTLWEYLRLLFFPVELVHDYYPAAVELRSWSSPTALLGLVLNGGLALYATLHLRQRPLLAFGILFYLLTLSIVSNLFFSVGTFMSERFVFMPSFGFALAVVAVAGRGNWPKWGLAAAIVLFSGLTLLRNPVWADNYTLFITDVIRQPASAKLSNAAAGARIDRYQELPEAERAARTDLLVTAERDLNRALTVHPTYRNAYLLRGNARLLLKRYDEAIADYDRALDLDGGYRAATDNLIVALQTAGRTAGEERNDLTAALAYLERARQLDPNNYETLRLLGVASGVGGQLERARDFLGRAAALRPDDAEAAWNHGVALLRSGRAAAAEAEFQRAERLKPGIRAERGG